MHPTNAALVDRLRSELGRELRLVGEYDGTGIDDVYVRDDIPRRRIETGFEELHDRVLRDHDDRGRLEDSFDAGEFRATLLSFEELSGVNFLGEQRTGQVVTVDADARLELPRFVRAYDPTAAAVRRFESRPFEHPPARESCTTCGSSRTITTPEAGPSSPYYCLDCDSGFT